MLVTMTTVWQFCVNFWVIFGYFGKEIVFLKLSVGSCLVVSYMVLTGMVDSELSF